MRHAHGASVGHRRLVGFVTQSPEPRGWPELPVAVISDCVDRAGVMHSAIRRMSGEGVAGPAYPVRVVVGDSATLHLALRDVPSGSVLVVDAGGYRDRAVWGEILTAAAQERGVVGVVIDGAVRDVAAIRRMGFPLHARSRSAAGPHKAGGGSIGVPVSCGGVVVHPGDMVIGDGDGIVVVPAERAEEVLEAARAQIAREREIMDRIKQGEATYRILGLGDGGEPG